MSIIIPSAIADDDLNLCQDNVRLSSKNSSEPNEPHIFKNTKGFTEICNHSETFLNRVRCQFILISF